MLRLDVVTVAVYLLFLFSPFIAWMLIPTVTWLVRRSRRDRYTLLTGVRGWTDVNQATAGLRTRSAWWGVAYGSRNFALAFAVGYGIWAFEGDIEGGRGPELVVVVVIAVALLVGVVLDRVQKSLADPLFTGTMYDTGHAPISRGSLSGQAFRLLGRILLIPVAVLTAFTVWDPIFLVVIIPGMALVVTLALAVDRLGLRMLARNAQEVRDADGRDPILYLRNFGDDRFRIQASRISRRGLIGRLSPRQTRPFEEIVAWRLNKYGPVVAVSEPNSRLANLGAAKMVLPHHNWLEEVTRLASTSLAVMVSAAPETINLGLRYELHMLANLPPQQQRIILLLPPRRKADLIAGWRSFCTEVWPYPLFRGAQILNPSGASQVLVHVPGEGWTAWGASSRTEWSYVAAVHLAMEYAVPRWTAASPLPVVAPDTGAFHRRWFLAVTAAVAVAAVGASVAATLGKGSSAPAEVAAPLPSADHLITSSADSVVCLAFSPDGRTLVSGQGDLLWRWDVPGTHATPLNRTPGTGDRAVRSVAFSPDGRTLAAGSDDAAVQLWDTSIPTRPVLLGPPLAGHTMGVSSVAFCSGSHLLASGSLDSTVRLWTVADPHHPAPAGRPLVGDGAFVQAIAFSPSGRLLAAGGLGVAIRLWDVSDPANAVLIGQSQAGNGEGVLSLAFSPDGKLLASGGDALGIRLWTVADPARPTPIGGPLDTGAAGSLAFSPDGRTLAVGSYNRPFSRWAVTDPERPTLIGPPLGDDSSGVDTVAFAPDGRTLAVGTDTAVIRLWPIP